MKISEVLDEFRREMATFGALDDRVGMTREESTIWVQTVFLRAACRLFSKDDKAGFAKMAKINWDSVHKERG